MPPAPVDPDRLRFLGAALGPLRECAGQGAEELLAQFPEVGHRETQSALDSWVEQAADLLREIDATASDLADVLRVAALNVGGSGSDAEASTWSARTSGEVSR